MVVSRAALTEGKKPTRHFFKLPQLGEFMKELHLTSSRFTGSVGRRGHQRCVKRFSSTRISLLYLLNLDHRVPPFRLFLPVYQTQKYLPRGQKL